MPLATGCGHDAVPPTPGELRLADLAGTQVAPLREIEAAAVVFLFVRTDCPISNRYAPDVKDLAATYGPRGVNFWLVYADPAETTDKIRGHLREYGYDLAVLRDPDHALVRLAGATITPEAAVFSPGGDLVYLGRIDDRFVSFGQAKPEPERRDLASALDELLAGRPITNPRTRAVGCYITGL